MTEILPPLHGKYSTGAVARSGFVGCNMCAEYARILEETQKALQRKYAHVSKLSKKLGEARAQNQDLVDRIIELEAKYENPCPELVLDSQSGAIGATGQSQMKLSSSTQQEIMGFTDQDAGWTTAIGSGTDATMDQVASIDSSLGAFMERPLEIASYTWLVGQTLLENVNPWKAFFDNPLVQKKLDNFRLARCKLHVKAVISGTGFHYGRVIMGYNPVHTSDQVTVDRAFIDQDIIQLSQKPHVFLNPSTNQGAEMCLPFFYRKNYVDLTRFEFDDLGELDLKSFGNLLTVNETTDPVVITLYAWTEDLVLTMPTEVLVSQSGTMDEFGMGIVSKPASAVAKAAGLLEQVPVIGVYARATEMVANAVAGVAQLFGYSRPPVVTDIQLYKPFPQGNLANVDGSDAPNPLSMDSKAELTIDSRTVGLDGVDQMSIKSIVTRESYLTSFNWSQSNIQSSLLWNARVSPSLYGVFGEELHLTPMCLMANMFQFWKGSIKFRFQVVCSDFHKGRMVISYDPAGASLGVNFNAKYNRVVDLATDRDFEIIVGWGQAEPFLRTFPPNSSSELYGTTPLSNQSTAERWNGTLQVNVVNRLVSPATDAPVRVNVYVSMCDDYKFGAPTADFCNGYSYFNPAPAVLDSQSGTMGGGDNTTTEAINEARPMEDKPTDPISIMSIADTASAVDHTYDVFFGESPQSLRDLFKRYILCRVWCMSADPTDDTMQTLRNKDLPVQFGRDPKGLDTVDDVNFFTVNRQGPLHKFLPCYAGWRGSIRRKYYFTGGALDKQAPVVNRFSFINDKPRITTSSYSEITNEGRTRQMTGDFAKRAWNGAHATLIDQNRAIEFQSPYYFSDRFLSPRIIEAPDLTCGSHLIYMNVPKIDVINDSVFNPVQEYIATGEDFSLFFWTGVPIMWQENSLNP